MHRSIVRLLFVWLAWCVAMQPVAQAMGGHCADADGPTTVHAQAGAAAQDVHDHAHHAPVAADAATKTPGATTPMACTCAIACTCDMAGCLGTPPGIGPGAGSTWITQLSHDGAVLPSAGALQAAHGAELIRPPSRS